MKISKTGLSLLTVGIFIITFASLSFARSQQIQEQNQLHDELSLIEVRLKNKSQLEQLATQQETLERQLSQTIAQSETIKATLSQPTESITASDTLFNIAQACDVEITGISSPGLATDDLEGLTLSVLPLTVRVEGDTPRLISFINRLNGNLTTGAVKSVEINIPETASEEKPSANIQLVIYTYQGD